MGFVELPLMAEDSRSRMKPIEASQRNKTLGESREPW